MKHLSMKQLYLYAQEYCTGLLPNECPEEVLEEVRNKTEDINSFLQFVWSKHKSK